MLKFLDDIKRLETKVYELEERLEKSCGHKKVVDLFEEVNSDTFLKGYTCLKCGKAFPYYWNPPKGTKVFKRESKLVKVNRGYVIARESEGSSLLKVGTVSKQEIEEIVQDLIEEVLDKAYAERYPGSNKTLIDITDTALAELVERYTDTIQNMTRQGDSK